MTIIKILIFAFCTTLTLNVSGQRNCAYKIDTASILTNRNLDNFLAALETDSFVVTNNKKDIPRFIKKQLRCMTNGFSIANPGQRFQATEVVEWRIKPLPRRQLVFLAKSHNMLVMTYYKGGFGKSGHVVFIKFQGKKISDLWTGNALNGMETMQGIIDNISQNRNKEWGLNTNIVTL